MVVGLRVKIVLVFYSARDNADLYTAIQDRYFVKDPLVNAEGFTGGCKCSNHLKPNQT
jgi:hypothetical protein